METQVDISKIRWKIASLIFLIFLIFLGSCFEYWNYCNNYNEVELGRNEIENGLKDFVIDGDAMISTSDDPWIAYSSDEEMLVGNVLFVGTVSDKTTAGCMCDSDDWYHQYYSYLHEKNNCIYIEDEMIQNFRFDLVNTENVTVKIDKIIINSKYGWIMNIIRKYGVMLLAVVLYAAMLFSKGKNRFGVKCGLFALSVANYLVLVNDSSVEIVNRGYEQLLFIAVLIIIVSQKYEVCTIIASGVCGASVLELLSCIEFKSGIVSMMSVYNIMIVVGITLLLYLITRRQSVSIIVTQLLMVILGLINYYYYYYRNEPFELADAVMADTALSIIDEYTYEINGLIIYVVLSAVLVTIAVVLNNYRPISKRVKRMAWVYCIGMILGMYTASLDVSFWNMGSSIGKYGYLASFAEYTKRDLIHSRPNGYSLERVSNIISRYDEEESTNSDVTPDIVVIMDEAFCDLPSLYGFETDADCMPFIHSMADNTVSGWTFVSSFGGGTANTEWEFLTGNSMAFSDGASCPYVQYVKKETSSFARNLKDMGYETVAIHPYYGKNYNRDKVYPYMGFDEFINTDDSAGDFWNLRQYSSDMSVVEKLISLNESSHKDGSRFEFVVTMQNHGGYSSEESELDSLIYPVDEDLQYVQLEEYLSLVRYTDEAFQKLIEYYSSQDKPTIVVLFGDHQPGLDAEIYDAMEGDGAPDYKQHMVPFVIWTNYDIEESSGNITSINYLRTKILQIANLPMSNYDRFLIDCEEKYPAVYVYGYQDNEGNIFGMSDDIPDDILSEYKMLEYANLFDKAATKYFE